jgi:hypothetical protein
MGRPSAYSTRYATAAPRRPARGSSPGDSASTYNGGPHGLRYFQLGGYLQINGINQGNTQGGVAQWCSIKLNGKTILGPGSGDVNRDGCVDDADLLTVLFNFGTGCGN